MLKYFICPDGSPVTIEGCLKKCYYGKRCLSLPTLTTIALGDRKWDGLPHVTNLMNGTLEEYLKITCDYSINPMGRAYALLGSGHHVLLEAHTMVNRNWISEMHLQCDFMQGTADLIMFNDEDATVEILDYKTWGSYKVGKVIGMTKQPDKTFAIDKSKIDMEHEILQLNAYRFMLKQLFPEYTCNALTIQATVRDGGVQIARSRGIANPIYMIDIPIITDEEVTDYFLTRAERLHDALKTNEPVICSKEECWYGRKCQEYCDVAASCPQKELMNTNGE